MPEAKFIKLRCSFQNTNYKFLNNKKSIDAHQSILRNSNSNIMKTTLKLKEAQLIFYLVSCRHKIKFIYYLTKNT